MMKIYKHILGFLTVTASLLLSSCEDKFDFGKYAIGEGVAEISAALEFKSDIINLGGSRSSGTAIRDIEDLNVVVYNNDGSPYKVLYLTGLTESNQEVDETPSDYPPGDDVKSEPKTRRVEFKMTLPYGSYYMYAVANLGRNLGADDASEEDKQAIQTIEGLKGISCDWKFDKVENNAQMFGYFTNSMTGSGSTAFEESDPKVVVNAPQVYLHSWIKRLASKVTVAFNGSGLRQGIFVYIHNVSIRQIPLSCTLGGRNKPSNKNEITGAYLGQSLPANERNQVIFYDSNGVTEKSSEYNPDGKDYEKWLVVAKGTKTDTLGCNHNPDAQALYFYENMQGDYSDFPDKKYYYKHQNPDSVGTGIGSGYDDIGKLDYQDNVPFGTFIEVEAYYKCNVYPVSYGKIRYRFMLGQDTEYNYDAIRNHHYKLTLGFNGYANQPDWHIEYEENPPEIFAPEVYIPYSYNTVVEYPVTIIGNVSSLTAEIIENNWAPYDENDEYEVAPATQGETNPDLRTLKFEWWRDVFINSNGYLKTNINMRTANFANIDYSTLNSANNFFYGRHPSDFYHLDDNNKEIKDEKHRYYVTPIWAGFLRLLVPAQYNIDNNNEQTALPTAIIRNLGNSGATNYGGNANGRSVLNQFRNYYYGSNIGSKADDTEITNTTDLHKRVFNTADLTEGWHGAEKDRNSYRVVKTVDKEGVVSTTLFLKLWTQPKSMCGISGFSGNNPYEDYYRKAVIRFTAEFGEGGQQLRDVTVLQSKRITNPTGVWRAHANPDVTKTAPDPFKVVLYQRDTNSRDQFSKVYSDGEWSAEISHVSDDDAGFISLQPGPDAVGGGNMVVGNTLSPIDFTIKFAANIPKDDTKCAIVEVRYHGSKSCVHKIFVRQGYNQPLKVHDNGPYWSSYNVFSADGNYGVSSSVTGELAHNPLLFGAYFKRGNYREAIAVSNITANKAAFGPLAPPGNNPFTLTGAPNPKPWSQINGNTTTSWKWAAFNIGGKSYRVPTIADFQTLLVQGSDLSTGVLYGDGANAPSNTTLGAFGFMDEKNSNNVLTSPDGMRGFFCFNTSNAHNIFFPVGTTGMGRRTIQEYPDLPDSYRGTLRYGSVNENFNKWSNINANSMRPIPMNMVNSPGTIYWVYTGVFQSDTHYYVGWDMNYFDFNFNGITEDVISINGNGGGGDALPLRLVTDTVNQ